MRTFTILNIVCIFILGVLLHSCGCEGGKQELEECEKEIEDLKDAVHGLAGVEISDNQVIIKFDPDSDIPIDDQRKNVEDILGIPSSTQKCSCGGPANLEFWEFTEDLLDIETKVSTIKKDNDEGVEGNIQFTFNLPEDENGIPVAPFESYQSLLPKIYNNANENTLVVAILDTGLDYRYFQDQEILYKIPEDVACNEAQWGWNFVGKGNDNIQDDNGEKGHGTVVTKLIVDNISSGKDFSVLPLKVFDENGKGSYWNIVCAMNYLNTIQSKTNNVIKLVNASFGGTVQSENLSFLSQEIERFGDSALLIASAGNDDLDTDTVQHIPSSYNVQNILAIGGYELFENDLLDKHEDSNYGVLNVDLSAKFEQILTFDTDEEDSPTTYSVYGTSFSTALVTARMADIIHEKMETGNYNPASAKSKIFSDSEKSTQLENFFNEGRYIDN